MKQQEIDRQLELVRNFLADKVILKKEKNHVCHGLYIGIDPGFTGAIGFLVCRNGKFYSLVVDIPVLELGKKKPQRKLKKQTRKKKRKKIKREFGNDAIHAIFSQVSQLHKSGFCKTIVYLERGQTFGNVARFQSAQQQGQNGPVRRESTTVAQRVGWATGMWPLYLQQGLGLLLTMVSPNSWKKKMELTSDKEACRSHAIGLFPDAELKRKKDHNRSEALLLAYYAYLLHHTELEPNLKNVI